MKNFFLAIPRFFFNLVKLLFGIMGFCMVLALLGFVIAEPILFFGGIFLAIISLLIRVPKLVQRFPDRRECVDHHHSPVYHFGRRSHVFFGQRHSLEDRRGCDSRFCRHGTRCGVDREQVPKEE